MTEWHPSEHPAGPGRYLVKLQCTHKFHSLAPINRQYPCHKVNIAYFNAVHGWHWSSFIKWDKETVVTHWAPIPEIIKEDKTPE